MKSKIKGNVDTILISVTTIIYAITLIVSKARVLLIYPPARYALIASMLIISALAIYMAIYKGRRVSGAMLTLLMALWIIMSWLHFIHPYLLNTWVLSGQVAVYCLVAIARGRYR